MRILFLADGRSPIALNWMRYFCNAGDEVHLVSLYPCQAEEGFASVRVLPVPFLAAQALPALGGQSLGRRVIPVRFRTALRQRLVPLGIRGAAKTFKKWTSEIQPDLIHAMRIPYEGMIAASAALDQTLLVSVWGNDFTLHATATRRMGRLTRHTLEQAQALHTDCEHDRQLAFSWGFKPQKPSIVLPGAGGVRTEIFKPPPAEQREKNPPTIINPRGMRAYVRNDVFFQAIAMVREHTPALKVICPAMEGEKQAQEWVEKYRLTDVVELLQQQKPDGMARLFQRAWVAVSLTEHDGTPNTLLEAMACGCFPVAGDLASIREWITPGVNGLLTPPHDAQAAAKAIWEALENPSLRQKAAVTNQKYIAERAEYRRVMAKAREFYERLTS